MAVDTGTEKERSIRPAGDRAVLLIPPRAVRTVELAEALRAGRIDGVLDALPAAETVLVTVRSPADMDRVQRELRKVVSASATRSATEPASGSRGAASAEGEPIDIPVHYDGADLDDVARILGIRREEVVAAHTGTVWRCAFVGFAPGFGYLESADGRLSVPRRDVPRTAIPAGAVALAGGYSAVYPRATPGGWRLIGRTDLRMWDVERDPPALVRAGVTVRFVDAEA